MEYNFNNSGFTEESTFKADPSITEALTLTVKATDGDGKEFTITVEPSNFVW